MKISIIVPCYNEKNTIEEIINRINRIFLTDKEIIVIDDKSTDGSLEILQNLKKQQLIHQLILHQKNQGKGAAVSSGFRQSTGDIFVIQDADLEYDPSEIVQLIQPIINQKADVVFGSRFIGGGSHRVVYFWHRVGNWILTVFSNIFTNLNLTDMETCYKAFKKEVVNSITIQEKGFGFEPEITAKISKIPEIRIYEIGISYYGRTYKEGKKISWKDGMRAIYCILKYNLFR